MDSDQAVIVAAAAADWDAALASVVMLLQVISMAVSFLAGLFMWRLVVLSKNQQGGFWLVGPVVLVLGSSAWAAPVVSFSTVSSDGNGSTVGGPFYVVQVTDSSTNYQVATFWTQADSVNGKCESSYVHTVGAFGVETYSAWATSIGSTWLSYFTTNVASDNGANAFLSDWSSNGATIWNQFLTQVVAGSVTYSDANWWTFYQAALAASPITSCMPGSSSPPSGWSSTFYSTLYGRSGPGRLPGTRQTGVSRIQRSRRLVTSGCRFRISGRRATSGISPGRMVLVLARPIRCWSGRSLVCPAWRRRVSLSMVGTGSSATRIRAWSSMGPLILSRRPIRWPIRGVRQLGRGIVHTGGMSRGTASGSNTSFRPGRPR